MYLTQLQLKAAPIFARNTNDLEVVNDGLIFTPGKSRADAFTTMEKACTVSPEITSRG